ncbi:MAG TPA: acyl carrier protein [Rhodocyclaceae bacterium]|nr:acyl carrier protein [Rhodocyclaceae bacterium]
MTTLIQEVRRKFVDFAHTTGTHVTADNLDKTFEEIGFDSIMLLGTIAFLEEQVGIEIDLEEVEFHQDSTVDEFLLSVARNSNVIGASVA